MFWYQFGPDLVSYQALFEWFVDIRDTLKARLPRKMFKTQFKMFYDQWLIQKDKVIPDDKMTAFSNHWIKNWMHDTG